MTSKPIFTDYRLYLWMKTIVDNRMLQLYVNNKSLNHVFRVCLIRNGDAGYPVPFDFYSDNIPF